MPGNFDFRIKQSVVIQALDAYKKMEVLLEKEKEIQLQNVRSMNESWKGNASLVTQRVMLKFVENGSYGETYRQVRAMRESLESALPRINALLVRCEEFPKQFKSNDYVPPYVPAEGNNTEYNDGILSLDYDKIDSLKDACDKVVGTTDSLTKSLADIVGECAGLIDGADECLEHLETASKKLHRIENFKTSFLLYAAGVRDLEEDLKVQWRAICAQESGDHSLEQVEVKTDSDAEEIPWTDEEVTRLCMELEEYVQTGDYDKMQEVMSALIVEDYEDRTTANGPMVYYTAKMNQKKQLQLLKKAEEMKLTGAYKFAVAMSGIQIEGLPVSEKGQGSYQIIFGDWAKKEHLIHVAVSTDQTAAWCETEVGDLSPDEEYTEWDRYIDLGLTGYVKYGYHEIVDYTPDGAMLFFGRTNTIVYVGSSMQAFVTGDMKQLDDYIIRNNRILSHGFVDGFWDLTLGGVENTIHSLGNNIKEPALYLVKTVKGNNGESTGQKAWKIPLAVLQLGAGVPLFTSGERAEKDIAAIKKVLSGDVKIPNREELKDSIKAVEAGIYADFQRDPNAFINNFIEKCYYGAGYISGAAVGTAVDFIAMETVAEEVAGSVEKADELIVRDSKFLDANGDIEWDKWAPNGGRVPGTIQEGQTLEKGTIIDRYGNPYGKYTSPVGTPYEQRGLPYVENPNAYHKYKVLKPIDNVVVSKIAEAFEQLGGGIQFELPLPIKELIKKKFLKEINW